MFGGNFRGLVFGSIQNEFLNYFYWNFLVVGNGLRVVEYVDLK